MAKDRELIAAFEEYIELLESRTNFKDISDAGLTPPMAKRLILALEPYLNYYDKIEERSEKFKCWWCEMWQIRKKICPECGKKL